MPASVAATYFGADPENSYPVLRQQGRLVEQLLGVPCPRGQKACASADRLPSLVLTASTVSRRVKLLRYDPYAMLTVVAERIVLALARCRVCKGRFRVLPSDIAPRKHYGLCVIEHTVKKYGKGDQALHYVVCELYGNTPAHTTLHAWTEGMGAYAQGRAAGEVGGAIPAARAVAEAKSRYPELPAEEQKPVEVNPARYRSDGRRERLAACTRFLGLAAALVAHADIALNEVGSSLVEWSRLVLLFCHSSPIVFRTGRRSTPFEHALARPERSSSSTTQEEEPACKIRTRSRSFATSRSPP